MKWQSEIYEILFIFTFQTKYKCTVVTSDGTSSAASRTRSSVWHIRAQVHKVFWWMTAEAHTCIERERDRQALALERLLRLAHNGARSRNSFSGRRLAFDLMPRRRQHMGRISFRVFAFHSIIQFTCEFYYTLHTLSCHFHFPFGIWFIVFISFWIIIITMITTAAPQWNVVFVSWAMAGKIACDWLPSLPVSLHICRRSHNAQYFVKSFKCVAQRWIMRLMSSSSLLLFYIFAHYAIT